MHPADRPANSPEPPPDAHAGGQMFRRILRRNCIAIREALPAAEVERRSASICQHLLTLFPELAGRRIGFCWPVRNEPDIRPALAAFAAQGGHTCLPVVLAENSPLGFRDWQLGDALENDRYGIPTPSAGPLVTPEVLLLPCNAIDAAGYRLGYGGGFFDRTLAALTPPPLAIGLAYEEAWVASIRPGEHDQPLAAVVTEAGAWRRQDGLLLRLRAES